MTPNYPNHPLFRIAPLLDDGFQTARFDPYERVLVAKIRAGRYTQDLWDYNGFCLNYHDRLDAPADAQIKALPSRHKLSPEQLAEYRRRMDDDPERRARREKLRAEREAWQAEKERISREYAERRAKQKADEEQRDREWKAAQGEWFDAWANQLQREEARAILAARWECSGCLRMATIEADPPGDRYFLGCQPCGRKVAAAHATLVAMMAHQAAPQPASAG